MNPVSSYWALGPVNMCEGYGSNESWILEWSGERSKRGAQLDCRNFEALQGFGFLAVTWVLHQNAESSMSHPHIRRCGETELRLQCFELTPWCWGSGAILTALGYHLFITLHIRHSKFTQSRWISNTFIPESQRRSSRGVQLCVGTMWLQSRHEPYRGSQNRLELGGA